MQAKLKSAFTKSAAVTRGVALDPGIIYTSADVLLFAGTNTVGLSATLTATGLAASLKSLSILQPEFLKKWPKLTKVAFDDRTPLRAGAIALVVVGGAALATGAMLPAAASLLFAMANFRLAESISRKVDHTPKTDNAKPSTKEIAKILFKRPELYLNAGFACAGFMAGGAALFVLPVVATAFGIGVMNALREKPESAGHPKMITAGAAGAFAGIGHTNGHALIAVAHAINAIVLVEMERRVTKGGMLQILKDMGYHAKQALPNIDTAQKYVAKPALSLTSRTIETIRLLSPAKRLTAIFKKYASSDKPAANENVAIPVETPTPDVSNLKRQLYKP